MQNKGRPCNQGEIIVEHQERPHKPEPVKEYWTEHRITLIAYEAQYIYSKRPNQFLQQKNNEGDKSKKNPRKKVNLQFEAGFLNVSPQNSQQFRVEQLVKEYEHLNWLFTTILDENLLQIKTFVKIMLQLKHSVIVRQFCQIYDLIIRELKNVSFQMVQKEQSRFQWLEQIKQKILTHILENGQKFPFILQYLKDDEKQTKKLILVEVYCFLAEKFNFNINQFYSEAFNVPVDNKSSKKVKKSS